MQYTFQELVEKHELLPHPEGGYYKETYRATEFVSGKDLPERFGGDRFFSTAIYFLIIQGNFSSFHKIKSDECWHFYAGDALHIHVIGLDGKYTLLKLGSNIDNGETFQAIVSAGSWFASENAPGGIYSFVGCTVSPGFDFADFELAKANELAKQYPERKMLIERLCRE